MTTIASTTARVSLLPPKGLFQRLLDGYARRRFGQPMEPMYAMAHHPALLRANAFFELRVDRLSALDPTLRSLAAMATAAAIGCAWCMDFGYFLAHDEGMEPALLTDLPRWRESSAYSVVQRRVIEFAEAASQTPPTVTDELADALRDDLGERAFVELAFIVAVENQRSRFNLALGMAPQGFSDRCRVPDSSVPDSSVPDGSVAAGG